VIVAGALFSLQNFDVDVGSVLAGLGIGGLAVALAAKDTIANFFGSVMIFVDQPFQVGDAIVVKGVEGTVEEVGFRSTRIRTPHNSQVSVPNAAFTEVEIDNYGRRRFRRVAATLALTYDTTPEQVQAFGAARTPSTAELAEVVRAFGPSGVRSNPRGPHIVPGGFTAEAANLQTPAERGRERD
jgi:small-conductance mechanosensitive channel